MSPFVWLHFKNYTRHTCAGSSSVLSGLEGLSALSVIVPGLVSGYLGFCWDGKLSSGLVEELDGAQLTEPLAAGKRKTARTCFQVLWPFERQIMQFYNLLVQSFVRLMHS